MEKGRRLKAEEEGWLTNATVSAEQWTQRHFMAYFCLPGAMEDKCVRYPLRDHQDLAVIALLSPTQSHCNRPVIPNPIAL